MKSFTDIAQSKKLAEIVPLESADMCFNDNEPCWSFTALFSIIQNIAYSTYPDSRVSLMSWETTEYDVRIDDRDFELLELVTGNDPVDACYEMIIKLNEQKLL